MTVIYPLGIPSMYLYLLRKSKALLTGGQREREKEVKKEQALKEALIEREKNEEKNPSMKSLEFLYSAYQPKFWWFEVFETSRKLALTGFLSFLSPGSFSQILVSLMMSMFYLFVYTALRPFSDEFDNDLAIVSQWQLVVTLCSALAIKASKDNPETANLADSHLFDVFLTASQFMPVLLLLFYNYLRARRKRGEGGRERSEGTRMMAVLPIAGEDGRDAQEGESRDGEEDMSDLDQNDEALEDETLMEERQLRRDEIALYEDEIESREKRISDRQKRIADIDTKLRRRRNRKGSGGVEHGSGGDEHG